MAGLSMRPPFRRAWAAFHTVSRVAAPSFGLGERGSVVISGDWPFAAGISSTAGCAPGGNVAAAAPFAC
ncbi:hypothetical protein GCM10017620_20560 [Brevundimonas intermedia]|uniref:Uncharacterized protein n=1 Tax=Brevundimonas intermedia TaxID=74315 RepID=A0ABQ5T9K6_9CAUL|nr:hypothetical protein GCM10017620_20560 [Brevundimonas intermedia]